MCVGHMRVQYTASFPGYLCVPVRVYVSKRKGTYDFASVFLYSCQVGSWTALSPGAAHVLHLMGGLLPLAVTDAPGHWCVGSLVSGATGQPWYEPGQAWVDRCAGWLMCRVDVDAPLLGLPVVELLAGTCSMARQGADPASLLN